jgi:hypothetical protein
MIFVRFIDGIQVEAIRRNMSPGEDWIAAPPDFDWGKRYKFFDDQFVAMTTEEIEQLYQKELDEQIPADLNDSSNSENPDASNNSENVEISEYPEIGGTNA